MYPIKPTRPANLHISDNSSVANLCETYKPCDTVWRKLLNPEIKIPFYQLSDLVITIGPLERSGCLLLAFKMKFKTVCLTFGNLLHVFFCIFPSFFERLQEIHDYIRITLLNVVVIKFSSIIVSSWDISGLHFVVEFRGKLCTVCSLEVHLSLEIDRLNGGLIPIS